MKRIEATAFVSPTAVPAMADAEFVADRVLALVPDYPQVAFSALVVNARGAERAIASGLNRLEYVVSAGDGHSRANSGRSTAEAIDAVADIAAMAHAANGECEVIVATAWDCPFDGAMPVERILQLCSRAVAAGADQLCLADTIGSAVPRRVIDLVDAVAAAVPGVPLGAHFHNTRGSGLANAWVALSRGVSMLDASAGGLGGCPFAPGASGNIATEELGLPSRTQWGGDGHQPRRDAESGLLRPADSWKLGRKQLASRRWSGKADESPSRRRLADS